MMAGISPLFLFMSVSLATLSVSASEYSSNVYGMDILNRLQTAISSKGCVGGICICSGVNREWSGVFSSGVTLPSILAEEPSTADEAKEINRALRQVNRIADSMPRADRILDTCKWTRTLFSEKFFMLLEKMVEQTTEDTKVEAVKAAICELNEAVPDPEPVGDVTEVPLFLLYLRYKQEYFTAKDDLAQKVQKEREARTDEDFKKWYQDNLEILRCDVDSAYQKWEIFGNKRKVEDLLVENDIVADSSLITNSLGLYNAVRDLQPTTDNLAEGIMPVTLTPEGWQEVLGSRTLGTQDQLLFEIAEMRVTEAELLGINSKRDSDATREASLQTTLNSTLSSVTKLSRQLHASRISCRGGDNQECKKAIMLQKQIDTTSDEFIQAYIDLRGIESTEGVEDLISGVRVLIRQTEAQLGTTVATVDDLNIPEGVQQISVTFNWTENAASLDSTYESMNLSDSFQQRPFLYLHAPPTDECEGCYNDFHEVLPETISTKLYFLAMERTWFDPTVLQKAYMKKIISELKEPFSPNAMSQKNLFQELQKRNYLLPFFPVSMVIATDIEITLRNVTDRGLVDIYKAAQTSSPLTLGFGPFTVVNALEDTYSSNHRYSVENINDISQNEISDNNKLKIRLGGGQIIGMQYQMLNIINTDDQITPVITVRPFNATMTSVSPTRSSH